MELVELLQMTIKEKASDLLIAAGVPPVIRIDGQLQRTRNDVLTPDECRRLIYSVLTEQQKGRFEREKELDFSLSVAGLARFRLNVHMQRGSVAAAIRTIPHHIPNIDELGLPRIVYELARKPRGLVLVTGPTGSGKSTTLASVIDLINSEQSNHIITVEDPIEYLHHHKKCVIEQREVEADTASFATALKYALRQDPDVILIGEMRDLETIASAITAAETGHLVFATLHTTDAAQTVDRMIDVFPPHQQQQIRLQLSVVLQGIFSQQLLPKVSGRGRCLACEVLIGSPAVQSLIREGKTHQLYATMETSSKHGMQTLDRALATLYKKGVISYETALNKARKKEDLARVMSMGVGV
jgi:twitching motility protein PilT